MFFGPSSLIHRKKRSKILIVNQTTAKLRMCWRMGRVSLPSPYAPISLLIFPLSSPPSFLISSSSSPFLAHPVCRIFLRIVQENWIHVYIYMYYCCLHMYVIQTDIIARRKSPVFSLNHGFVFTHCHKKLKISKYN